MKRTINISCFLLLLLLGSVLVFFGFNCLMSIILNLEAIPSFSLIFGALPHLLLVLFFISLVLYISRFIKLPLENKPAHTRSYLIQFIVYGVLGLIFSLFAGFFNSSGFSISNPYNGVLIVLIISDLLIIGGSVTLLVFNIKKHKNNPNIKVKYNFKHILYTSLLAILILFSTYRFGAFIWSFVYMDVGYFWLTIPFYLSLLLPLIILVFSRLDIVNIKLSKRTNIISWSIILILSLFFGIYTFVTCYTNPLFLSITSAAMPIERLITYPFDLILLYSVNLIFPAYYLIKALLNKR